MASVYRKKTGIYYISVMFQNNRITRSLGTRSYQSARKVISHVEKKILSDILEGKLIILFFGLLFFIVSVL